MRPPPTVISIGTFDGVHAGHAAIVRRAHELAQAHNATGGVTVLSFDPHPLTRLAPERAPARLTTFLQRTRLLTRAGATTVERLEPTDDILALTPAAFLEWVIAKHNPVAFVEGHDFRFGKDKSGSLDTLRALCQPRGIVVETVPAVAAGLSDDTVVTASSSIARWLLERGRVRDAWAVLAHPYRIEGVVVQGDRRGRTLGFPTANIDSPNLIPADGVYATLATLPDGSTTPGALSVGTKPQFGAHARTAEVYLLGVECEPNTPTTPNLPGLPEYGWPICLDLVGWVREQMRFATVEHMLEQIHRDCGRVSRIVDTVTTEPRHSTAPELHHGTTA